MKERPILMQTENVRAILEDRKTQTRRICRHVNGNPDNWKLDDEYQKLNEAFGGGHAHFWNKSTNPPEGEAYSLRFHCPHGETGDRLWVRETWYPAFKRTDNNNGVIYYCSGSDFLSPACREHGWGKGDCSWKPSIFMPRWASRITLEIIGVRVEQLQEITDEDALAEGVYGDETPYDQAT